MQALPSVSGDTLPSEPDLDRRFGGMERLYGVQGAAAVRRAHVVVVGIGGVGSWAAEALARSGVGALTLVDLDHVAESNINRQIHALDDTVGQAKVLAMQDRIRHINSRCQVLALDEFATADNWPSLIGQAEQSLGPVTAVLDACDQMSAKTTMAAWALSQGKRLRFITVGAAGGKRHAQRVEVGDLAQATHDPLMAQLRQRLRKHHGARRDGKAMGVQCVFSREPVAPPDASCAIDGDGSLNCHGYGSMVSVTATFGLCAAGWLIDQISQKSTLYS